MSTYSIQILVLNSEQNGIKIYNRPIDWSGGVINFSRSMVKDVKAYVLWNEEQGHYSVYVGKSDNIISRTQEHVDCKDFWTKALIMVSTNNISNSAHVGWIEANLVQKVKELSGHNILDCNQPYETNLNFQDKPWQQHY